MRTAVATDEDEVRRGILRLLIGRIVQLLRREL